MHELEPEWEVAGGWVKKAENDLRTAVHTLKLGDECPTDTVCFHAQQCVEKYVKALLVSKGIDFSKTHDIEELMTRAFRRADFVLSIENQRRLTSYATTTRYPGGYEPISLPEAQRATALARQARKVIRKLLPPEVLRRVTK